LPYAFRQIFAAVALTAIPAAGTPGAAMMPEHAPVQHAANHPPNGEFLQ